MSPAALVMPGPRPACQGPSVSRVITVCDPAGTRSLVWGAGSKTFACVGFWVFMWVAGGVPSLMWVGRSLMWASGCSPGRLGGPGARVWAALVWSMPEGGEQYVGVMSGIVSDRMSGLCRYFVGTMSGVRRDYVGIASGLCRGYVGAMSGFGLPYVGSKSKPRRRDMPQKGPPRPSLAN